MLPPRTLLSVCPLWNVQVAHLQHRADNDAALLDQPIDEVRLTASTLLPNFVLEAELTGSFGYLRDVRTNRGDRKWGRLVAEASLLSSPCTATIKVLRNCVLPPPCFAAHRVDKPCPDSP